MVIIFYLSGGGKHISENLMQLCGPLLLSLGVQAYSLIDVYCGVQMGGGMPSRTLILLASTHQDLEANATDPLPHALTLPPSFRHPPAHPLLYFIRPGEISADHHRRPRPRRGRLRRFLRGHTREWRRAHAACGPTAVAGEQGVHLGQQRKRTGSAQCMQPPFDAGRQLSGQPNDSQLASGDSESGAGATLCPRLPRPGRFSLVQHQDQDAENPPLGNLHVLSLLQCRRHFDRLAQ